MQIRFARYGRKRVAVNHAAKHRWDQCHWHLDATAALQAGGQQGIGLLLADGVCSSRLRPGSARIWRQQRNEGSRHDHDA